MKKLSYVIILFCIIFTNKILAKDFLACPTNNLNLEVVVCNNKNYDFSSLKNEKNIKKITMRNTNLKNIPKEIYNLRQLTYLDLSKNNITDIPDDIEKLSNLEVLILDNNSLDKFPTSLTKLKKLKKLSINYNSIVTIPESINELNELNSLSFSNNSLTVFPELELSKLKTLDVAGNLLIYLPELEKTNLTSLKVEDNILGIPEIKSKVKIFKIDKQNSILTTSNEYVIEQLWFNKENMIINNTELSNGKKPVGFIKYDIVNLQDENGVSVNLSEYLDLKSNEVIKSGSLKGEVEITNKQKYRFVIKNSVRLKFSITDNNNNINNDNNLKNNIPNNDKNIADNFLNNNEMKNTNYRNKNIRNNFKRVLHNEQSLLKKNEILTRNEGSSNFNHFLHNKMQSRMNEKNKMDYYSVIRVILLSVAGLFLFIFPYLIVSYLINKIKKSVDSLKQI